MKQNEILNNIGAKVYVDGGGDLAFNGELRPIISYRDRIVELTIIKLNKNGKVYLQAENKKFYSVPCRNVILIE